MRLLVSGIFFCNSNLSAMYFLFKKNPLVSILFTLLTNLLYSAFLILSFFIRSLSLLKSTGTGASLSISSLSTLFFKLATFVFNAKLEVSTCVIFLISFLLHN